MYVHCIEYYIRCDCIMWIKLISIANDDFSVFSSEQMYIVFILHWYKIGAVSRVAWICYSGSETTKMSDNRMTLWWGNKSVLKTNNTAKQKHSAILCPIGMWTEWLTEWKKYYTYVRQFSKSSPIYFITCDMNHMTVILRTMFAWMTNSSYLNLNFHEHSHVFTSHFSANTHLYGDVNLKQICFPFSLLLIYTCTNAQNWQSNADKSITSRSFFMIREYNCFSFLLAFHRPVNSRAFIHLVEFPYVLSIDYVCIYSVKVSFPSVETESGVAIDIGINSICTCRLTYTLHTCINQIVSLPNAHVCLQHTAVDGRDLFIPLKRCEFGCFFFFILIWGSWN